MRCSLLHSKAVEIFRGLLAAPDESWEQPYVLDFDWLPPEARTVSRRKVAAHALFHSQRHWAQLATLVRAGRVPLGVQGGSALQPGAALESGSWPSRRLWHRNDFALLLEAGAAQHRPALGGLEGNRGLRAALRTGGPGLRTDPVAPRARFALHCLQCLGSFLNCLSWKNSCSPAVKTNSAPQSMHVNTRSVNSMAGFPEAGNRAEIGHDHEELAGPVSLFPCVIHNKGPGRNKFSGKH